MEIQLTLPTKCKIHRGNEKSYNGFCKEFWWRKHQKWTYLVGTLKNWNEKIFYKQISLESNKEEKTLEKRVEDIGRDIQNLGDDHEYLACVNRLEAIYDDKVNVIKLRSHCNRFESGKRTSISF